MSGLRFTRLCLVAFSLLAAGCPRSKGTATFPGLMVPGAGVGSIVVPWDSPKQTTWVCSQAEPSELSRAPAEGSSASSREIAATLGANIKTWLVAKGGNYKKIEKVDVTLAGGTLESAPLGSINLRLDRMSEGCRDAIGEQRRSGARYFKIISKLYRGDISVTVKFSTDASIALQSNIKEAVKADLSASFSDSTDGTMKVTGGVWILEMEPVTLKEEGSNGGGSSFQDRRTEQKVSIGNGVQASCRATNECSDVPDGLRTGGFGSGRVAKTVVFSRFPEGTAMLRWNVSVRGLAPGHANKPHDHCYCNTPWSLTRIAIVANGSDVGLSEQSEYINYQDNSCLCGPDLVGEAVVKVPTDGRVIVAIRIDRCGRGETGLCHIVNDSFVQLEAL